MKKIKSIPGFIKMKIEQARIRGAFRTAKKLKPGTVKEAYGFLCKKEHTGRQVSVKMDDYTWIVEKI